MQIFRNDIISHRTACEMALGAHLTKGMNFRIKGQRTVILMSVRADAPYADRIENDGATIIYEGHDVPRGPTVGDPKQHDQPMFTGSGALTENGKFYEAAKAFARGESPAEHVFVFEKLAKGIWSYNGIFKLVDAWTEVSAGRKVFKFRLELEPSIDAAPGESIEQMQHNRIIPTEVKIAVLKRDKGRCVKCGSTDMLHFDHILPYSMGGSSVNDQNIQLLCARHNLQKGAKVE